MNIEYTLKKKLIDYGLWGEEADAILEIAKADIAFESMEGRWTDDAEGYPSTLLAALWISTKSIAADWLKANKPNHWACLWTETDA